LGQAKQRGTYDERVAQAVAGGRKKTKYARVNPWLTRGGEGLFSMLKDLLKKREA
jgi:hypothetical protein